MSIAVIVVLVITLSPSGHYWPFATEVATARSLFNALSNYASDHEGRFPETADGEFLDECIRLGYLTESDWTSCTLKGAPPGSTGFLYIKGQSQAARGSNLIAISEQPIIDPKGVPHYVTLTIAGKAEALKYDELVPILAQTIWRKAERDMKTQKADQSQQ